MILDKTKLTQLVYGAALLGSGGGGAIQTGLSFVDLIMENTGNKGVPLLSFTDGKDLPDVTGCVLCDIGAITAIESNQAAAIKNAYTQMENYYRATQHRDIGALLPIETGPENTLAPFVMASYQHLPVIDADGAGRAVPELGLSAYSLLPPDPEHGCPAMMANDKADWLLVNSHNVNGLDDMLRSISDSPQFGASASLCLWTAPLPILYQYTVPHSISTAMYCGQLLAGIQTQDAAMIAEALPYVNQLQGAVLGSGKVLEVTETATGGFDFGKVAITDQRTGSIITIMNQNENLIAFSSNSATPLCCAPDAICYVDDQLHPLTNDEIREGMQVYVLAVKGRRQLYQAHILNGFRRVLTSLGYAGKRTDLEAGVLQPLGSLLQGLS